MGRERRRRFDRAMKRELKWRLHVSYLRSGALQDSCAKVAFTKKEARPIHVNRSRHGCCESSASAIDHLVSETRRICGVLAVAFARHRVRGRVRIARVAAFRCCVGASRIGVENLAACHITLKRLAGRGLGRRGNGIVFARTFRRTTVRRCGRRTEVGAATHE